MKVALTVLETAQAQIRAAKQRVAEAEALVPFLERVAAGLPSTLPAPRFIHRGGYLCDGSVHFDAATRADAVAILAQLPGVPAMVGATAREGARTVTVAPSATLVASDPSGRQYPIRDAVAPFHYTVQVYSGHHQETLGWWWLAASALLLQVEVTVHAYTVGVRVEQTMYRGPGRYVVGEVPSIIGGRKLTRGGEPAQATADGGWTGGSGRWEWTFPVNATPEAALLGGK